MKNVGIIVNCKIVTSCRLKRSYMLRALHIRIINIRITLSNIISLHRKYITGRKYTQFPFVASACFTVFCYQCLDL